MRLLTILALISSTVLLTSCGSNTPSKTVKQMAKIKNQQEAKSYYTKRTVELIDELEKMVPAEEDSASDYRTIKQDGDWKVIDESIDGDMATVTVKITSKAHPSPMTYDMRMKKEDGKWKIDQEAELQAAVNAVNMTKNASKALDGMGEGMNKAMKALGNMLSGQEK